MIYFHQNFQINLVNFLTIKIMARYIITFLFIFTFYSISIESYGASRFLYHKEKIFAFNESRMNMNSNPNLSNFL